MEAVTLKLSINFQRSLTQKHHLVVRLLNYFLATCVFTPNEYTSIAPKAIMAKCNEYRM